MRRCQSQCPAWATGKPLSPKQLILDLRDHAFAKAPYLLATEEERGTSRRTCSPRPSRPLVGDHGGERRHRPGRDLVVHQLRRVRRGVPGRHRAHRPHRRDAPPPGPGRVRLPDRGHHDAQQPGAQGQPVGHGRGPPGRLDHRARLRGPGHRRDDPRRHRVPVLGRLRRRAGGPGQEDHQGGRRAAAHRRRQVRGPRPGRDLHRRPGAPPGQRVRLPDARPAERRDAQRGRRARTGRKVIASCPHCFNTIAREYPQLGGDYEVIHHTQLLAKLVEEGKLSRSTRSRRRSPTTTRASWAVTTRSSARRARSSTRCPVWSEEMHRRRATASARPGGARMVEERTASA